MVNNRRQIILEDSMKLADILLIYLCSIFTYRLRFDSWEFSIDFTVLTFIVSILYLISMLWLNGYSNFKPASLDFGLKYIILSLFIAFTLMISIGYLLKTTTDYSRLWAGIWVLSSVFLLIFIRVAILLLLKRFNITEQLKQRVMVLSGTSKIANKLSAHLVDTIKYSEYTLIDTVKIDAEKIKSNREDVFNGILVKIIKEKPDTIVLLFNKIENEMISNRLAELDTISTNILTYEAIEQNTETKDPVKWTIFNGIPLVKYSEQAISHRDYLLKSALDLVLGSFALFIFSPIMIIVAILIKLTSSGPVIFKQLRHGYNGQPFYVYKFRSMYVHHEEKGQVTQAKKGDLRITKIGAFLRKTSLDEVPQLFNVLKGEMSLVGPRPHAMQHNELYKSKIAKYISRHRVKPGITGWAQVCGYRGETDTDDKMRKRIEYDLYYINNWGILFDLKILFLTLFVGFIHPNSR